MPWALLRSNLFVTPPTDPKTKFLILSDSKYAMEIARGKFKPRVSRGLARTVCNVFSILQSIHLITLAWVPGHEGVLGNEVADTLAGQATKGSNHNTPSIIHDYWGYYGKYAVT